MAESSDEDRRLVWAHGDYARWNIVWGGGALPTTGLRMAHLDRLLLNLTALIHRLEMQKVYVAWERKPIALWHQAVFSRPRAGAGRSIAHVRRLACSATWFAGFPRTSPSPAQDGKGAAQGRWVR
ncbi:MAG TPA: hypothetical protein EYP14_10960 [Planctomycetaceae bacterium]|nr:hypothetical protein [Planctomycetaceae bacterium]